MRDAHNVAPDPAGCQVHKTHAPRVSRADVHHIVPRAWGGQDVPENRVTICPTGHRNVHECLLLYVAAKGLPAKKDLMRFGAADRALAHRGWVGSRDNPTAPSGE